MMIHCEDDQTVRRATEALLAAGRRAPGEHGRSRPAHAEVLAVERAVDLAGEADTPVYIVHISTAGAAERVAAARANGRRVYGETCPQYLLLSEASYDLPGLEPAKFVCAPPLRSRSDQAALWQGLASGSLQSVGTDHCPFNYVGQKDRGADDFSRIPGGLPGIETRLALLHSYGVRPGRLTLRQWVELCCQAPARLFGLYPRKGSLEPGADADVVVFDPQRQVTLHHGGLHERVDYTPYEGLPLTGYPVLTVSRGRVVMQDGEFTGRAGQGRFLHAAPPDFGAKTDAG
jgi:dihydropyrimidinase